MKIYTVAKIERKCYGHGDFGEEEKIGRIGVYGTGDWPKAFRTREGAQAYMDSFRYHEAGTVIVELEVVE